MGVPALRHPWVWSSHGAYETRMLSEIVTCLQRKRRWEGPPLGPRHYRPQPLPSQQETVKGVSRSEACK